MKTNFNLIVSKCSQKYEFDHCHWITYVNFEAMYDNIGDELVEASVAIELDVPECIDKEGNITKSKHSYRFKVTHKILHLYYCLITNELSNNASRKGDGYVGGSRLSCEKELVSKKSSSN